MCGDLEDDASNGEAEIHAHFIAHAKAFLAALRAGGGSADPVHRHLDQVFRDILAAAIDAGKLPKDMTDFQRLSMEPLAFARAAGFMAAHMPLSEDPLRRIVEAMMLGYAEGETAARPEDRHHEHSHDHGHDHGHGHSH